MFSVDDKVKVLREDLSQFKITCPVAHIGKIVQTNTKTSFVEIEVWGRPESMTRYFPLEFSNDRLVKIN